MLYCKKCGTQLDDDAEFCHICGTPVPKTKSSSSQKDEKIAPHYGQTIQRHDFVYGVVNLENLPAGHIIDERYEIKRKIGQGGFGAVYLAFDRRMQIDKAIKVIPEILVNDVVAMDNLRQEARTMIRLKHPNIIHVYDLHEGKISYIDMEYIDGVSLAEYRISKPEKRLTEDEVKQIALQILDGLGYAHSQKVIHRDIKPQNIMLTQNGKIKIMDFGIAETLRTSMSMIQNTSTTGTLVYMAPEQLRGQGISRRSDIYSLGATLYELLNGKPPFYTGDITYQILHEEPKPLPHVSREMNAILLTCLQKDQSKRFQSCEDMKRALESGKIEIGAREEKIKDERLKIKGDGRDKIKDERLKIKKEKGKKKKDKRSAGGKWVGVAALVLVLVLVGLGLKEGWFGAHKKTGVVTMEDMKDESWQQLTDLEKQRIETLLKEADHLFITDRLVEPPDNNAYALYQKVLKIHPGNKYALAQLGLIKKDFLKRGELEYGKGNYAGALNIAQAGLGYFSGDEALQELQKKSRLRIMERQARALAKQQKYIAPAGQNAYALCRKILDIDAQNPVAQVILKEIAAWFARRGQQAEKDKDWATAVSLYSQALEYFKDDPTFQQRLAQSRKELERKKIQKARAAEAERQKWLGIEWAWVEGGSFEMGCTSEQSDCDSDEEPVHTVTVDGFYMSKYEVTFAQYDAFCEATGRRKPSDSGWGRGNRPVIYVSWNDAVAFCKWLSQKTGTTIRLPTEAEWEYAARGGQKSRGYQYAGSNDVDAVAWYDGNSGNKTHPVGQKQPNELGLYDMSGNVYEWCLDWYDSDYYSRSPRNNPRGPSSGSVRVVRGGSWSYGAGDVRVADRDYDTQSDSGGLLGFRLLRTK